MFGTPDSKLLLRSGRNGTEGWVAQDIPSNVPGAFHQWVGHIQNGTTADENIALALDLTKLMEASNLSAASGRSVDLASLEK